MHSNQVYAHMNQLELTDKEIMFLEAYAFLRERVGGRPSLSQLTRRLGYKSTNSVRQFYKSLHLKGVDPDKYQPKLKQGRTSVSSGTSNTVSVPVLGTAPCGSPFFAEQNWEGEVTVDTSFIKGGKVGEHFILKASGDSMNRAGIEDGDYVLFRSQAHADSGERVVAVIGDEATIKVFKPGDGYVALMPKSSNSSHSPIVLSDDARLQGVVKAVFKSDVIAA